MVRAILEDRKTQTRRVMALQPTCEPTVHFGEDAKLRAGESFKGGALATWPGESEFDYYDCHCPYGGPGDRLWVRENFGFGPSAPALRDHRIHYQADGATSLVRRWKPSIHLPRAYSRITLDMVAVRVERLQDISETDAMAEGLIRETVTVGRANGHPDYDVFASRPGPHCDWEMSGKDAYARLWKEINGPKSWDANPWVWVVEFRRVTA